MADLFAKNQCEFVIQSTGHTNIKNLVSSILDWHTFDPERYPSAAQRKLVSQFFRRYSEKAEQPIKVWRIQDTIEV